MIKLVAGVLLTAIFLYMLRIVLKMSKVASKHKELADVVIDEEVASIDKEIQTRRRALQNGEVNES